MKKTYTLIIDLIFLTRPIIVVPVWGFSAFGVYAFYHKSFFTFLAPSQYLLLFLYSLAPAAVYVINQIADYEVDKTNAGFPLLVRGNIPMKAAWGCAAVCALLSILGPLIMGSISVAVLALIAIVAGCIYSCKPFSLSGRPFSDFLTNAFEAGLAVAAGWCVAGGGLFDMSLYQYALPYFLLMCAGSISSTLPDIFGDKAHGKITTAVYFGPASAHIIALGCLIAAVPASLLISADYLALSCAVLVIPIYILYLINPSVKNMELAYKMGGTVTMIAATLAVPLLLPAGILVFFATRLYFRKRYGIAYPAVEQS